MCGWEKQHTGREAGRVQPGLEPLSVHLLVHVSILHPCVRDVEHFPVGRIELTYTMKSTTFVLCFRETTGIIGNLLCESLHITCVLLHLDTCMTL